MCANVKYPREHRIPGYAQKAAFFHLEIVTMCASLQYYTVLVYASVLVGAVHFRLFPIFKAHFHCQAHLLDTIYCIHIPRYIYIQCTPVPCSLRSPARACARVRALPCPCARLLMPGQRWTFLSAVPVRPALLARVRARWRSPFLLAVAVVSPARSSCLRPCLPARVACLLPLFASFYSPIMYILRRYARPARRVSAPP